MTAKRALPASPLKVGLKHAGFSFLTFALLGTGLVFAVNSLGDKNAGSPKQVVALFSAPPNGRVELKDRLSTNDLPRSADIGPHEEPSLGIADLHSETIADPKPTQREPIEPPQEEVRTIQVADTDTTAVASLPKAPIDGVWEWGSDGRMPKIADDGRTPLSVYKRPHSNPAGRPEISIIVGGLGLNRRVTQAAIDELPPQVTLSFVPYSRGLQTWIDRARAAGHEVLIEFPMEPYDYPNNDTGPYTLLTTANAAENRRRAEWVLSQAQGYFGTMNYQGAKFATDSRAISPIFELLNEKGLSFVHDGSAPRSAFGQESESSATPFTEAARVIDADPTSAAIDEQLLHLEAIALQRGRALGTGFGFPVTVDQLRDWTETLPDKGYVLAPASAQLRTPISVRGTN